MLENSVKHGQMNGGKHQATHRHNGIIPCSEVRMA